MYIGVLIFGAIIALLIMRLYIDGILRPKAEVIVRSVTYHAIRGDFEVIPVFSCPKDRSSAGLIASLKIDDLHLDTICASGRFCFIHLISDGAPVNRKAVRLVIT